MTARAENMDRYRGVNNSGHYAATGLLRAWPADGPPLLWKKDLGNGWANVAVVDGKVYIPGGLTIHLYVFDLDGNPLQKALVGTGSWKKWPGSRTTPLVHAGVAAVGTPSANYVGIDLETGEPRWQLNAWKNFGSGKGEMGWGWPESPMRHEHKLIFNPCSRDPETPGVVAIDMRDGKTVWAMPGRSHTPADPKGRYSAADTAGSLFSHNGRDLVALPTWCYLVGLDAATGKLLWEFRSDGEKTLAPIYGNGRLLWNPGGGLQMLQLSADGSAARVLWTRSGYAGFSGGTILDDRVYVLADRDAQVTAGKGDGDGSASDDENADPPRPAAKGATALLCLDAATGKLIASLPSGNQGHVVSAEGMVYATDAQGGSLRVRLIRPTPAGMEVAGTLQAPSGPANEGGYHFAIAPVIAEGRLFIRYGTLYVYDLRVEKPAIGWRHNGAGEVDRARPALPLSRIANLQWSNALDPGARTLVLSGDRAFVGGPAQIRCLDAATGGTVWTHKQALPQAAGAAGRWNATPVVREDAVFAAFADGTVARLSSADGKPHWVARLDLAGPIGPAVLSEGVLALRARDFVALEAATGRELWKHPLPPGVSGTPAKLRLEGVGYFVTPWGWLVRANDGAVVNRDLPTAPTADVLTCQDRAYLCADRAVAIRLTERKGEVVFDKLWETRLGAPAVAPVVRDGLLFVPTARPSLAVLHAESGKLLVEHPLPAALTAPPVLAGPNLWLPGTTTLVTRSTAKLDKLWDFGVTGGLQAISFADDRVLAISGTAIHGLAGPAPAEPRSPSVIEVAALAHPLPAGLPLGPFVSEQMPREWLWAAPITGRDLVTDPLAPLGGRQKAVPAPGATFKVKDEEIVFKPLAKEHIWQERYTNNLPVLDLTAVHGRKWDTTGLYVTALDNDRDRWVRLATMLPGGSHWRARMDYVGFLSGQKLDESTPIRLARGKHVLLLQIAMGECESWGKIFIHPRLIDITQETEKKLARHRADLDTWHRYQAEEAGKPLVLP
jgi:outer membrane protein assembly factor BamB